ncbi:MAG: co-chaperone GroES [Patescibacteria group bacterium]|nr:co-chaperone GroES [Patescibacteria group bacterium]
MMNESGLRPLGQAVLVQAYEPERKKSMIVMPDIVEERTQMVEMRAVVVAVGPACWEDEKAGPRAKPGDKVLVSKYAGVLAKGTADGKQYRLVNARDIFCAIEIEKESSDE